MKGSTRGGCLEVRSVADTHMGVGVRGLISTDVPDAENNILKVLFTRISRGSFYPSSEYSPLTSPVSAIAAGLAT